VSNVSPVTEHTDPVGKRGDFIDPVRNVDDGDAIRASWRCLEQALDSTGVSAEVGHP